jgi:hypothetical protein
MQSTGGPRRVGLVALLAIATTGAVLLATGGSGVRTEATVATIVAAPLVATTGSPTLPDALGVPARGWAVLPEAPVRARPGPAAVWTGSELIVWGGGNGGSNIRGDGAALDVASATWRELSPAPPAFPERMWHTAAWSGAEVLFWGGYVPDAVGASPGGAYDVATDRWALLDSRDDGERRLHTAVWTGNEMLVWGGLAADSPAPVGLSVIPESRAGRPVPGVPIVPRSQHTAIWTGTEMLIWGGRSAEEPFPAGGAAYAPAREEWRTIPAPATGGRTGHTAIWTGTEMIVWGGARLVQDTELGDGSAYDPATDAWRDLPPSPIAPRRNHVAVWTGSEMIVWGGEAGVIGFDGARGSALSDGAAYDPATDTWRLLPDSPGRGSAGTAAVWAGEAGLMLVWGTDSQGQEVGLAYRPAG